MKLEWNLSEFFKDEKDFYQALEQVDNKLQELTKEDKNLDENTLLEILNKKYAIKEQTNNILVYASLRYYKNVKSENCTKLKQTAEILNNKVDKELSAIDRNILNLGEAKVKEYLTKNKELKTYELFLNNLFRKQQHITDEKTTTKIKDNENKINEQITAYNTLLRDMKYEEIEVDKKKIKLTNANIAKYLPARDQNTRKSSHHALNSAYQEHQEEYAKILDTIFEKRIENAHLEKYSSVLEKSLYEENIDPNIITTLISTVNQNTNLIQEYLKIKANLLNIKTPHLYDLGVPIDNKNKTKYTIDDAIKIIKEALSPLGGEYLQVVEKLLDGHIDAIPSEEKHQSLTFSWHTYAFLNFRGSYTDLKNLIHETGHIVNYYLSKQHQPFIYEDSTIFVGEVSSIVNETLLLRYLYKNAKTKEEKLFFLSKEIENYFTSVFKQTMYTEFENDLYQTKLRQPLTTNLLSDKYQKLIKKYYGKDIIYDEEGLLEWARLGHLYRWSYYPYQYATGLIMANIIVTSILDDKTLTPSNYLDFLSKGSSLYSLDLLKTLNVDLTNENVIKTGLSHMEEDIKELKKLSRQTTEK